MQSQKPSSAMMKLALMRTATGKEEPEFFAAEVKFISVTSFRNCSPNNISTSTVQRRLCESGIHGRIAAKKPLLKDTNNKKRLAWTKKHKQWTLDQW